VSVPFSSFDLAAQRDVRGEWAYVTTSPPFRIHSPLTVLAYRLPHQLAHLVIKRRGPAERLTDDVVHELVGGARSVAVGVRQASGIDHTIAVPPPPPLPAEPSADVDLGPDFLVWTADPEQARTLLTTPVRDYLRSPASGRHELVVEALGPLVLCYCASSGALDEGELFALDTFARELVERILSELTPQSPRGVGY
jgi:hypothetical protein